MSRYQKGKTISTSLQTDKHASTPTLSFFKGRMPFLLPNQQGQSTEGTQLNLLHKTTIKSSYNKKLTSKKTAGPNYGL